MKKNKGRGRPKSGKPIRNKRIIVFVTELDFVVLGAVSRGRGFRSTGAMITAILETFLKGKVSH